MENKSDTDIQPIAIPGIHEKFYEFLKKNLNNYSQPKILDIGAGQGYLVKKLYNDGYSVDAADLFPEYYKFKEIKCIKADICALLPYADSSFDVVVAVEVMEHVFDHELFLSECFRILRPNGILLFSTPNILSLKSRFRFLLSGFFYSFSPLNPERNDGLQHTSALTLDQYRYLGLLHGFKDMEFTFDKKQSTSRFLLFLLPFIRLHSALRKMDYKIHNTRRILTGRVLFLKFHKPESSDL